jgi:ribosome-associated translation inhibitor RaiA
MKKILIFVTLFIVTLFSINNVNAIEELNNNYTAFEKVLKKLERLNVKTLLKAVEKIDLIIDKYKEKNKDITKINNFKLKIIKIIESKI